MRYFTSALAPALLLLVLACSPAEPGETENRTADELVTQIADSYNNGDITAFIDCFSEDFVFHVHELDVGLGLDSIWFLSTEVSSTAQIFAQSDSIYLELVSQSVAPWHQDSTLVQITCQFDLNVIEQQVSGTLIGYRAQGETWFIAEETSTDFWTVVEWFDLSSVKESSTWSRIKWLFLPESSN